MCTPGSISTIFEFDCAALVLLNSDEDKTLRFLRIGKIAINLVTRAADNIVMTTCRVRDLEWPVAKDAPVVRVGERSFAFGMPAGLLFGVQFPPFCKEDAMDALERVLLKYSDYTNLLCEGRQAYPYSDNDLDFWTNIRPEIEDLCSPKLAGRFGHHLVRSASPGSNGASSNLLRAVRTCAATRIVADAIFAGLLKSEHISVLDTRRLRDRARRAHMADSEEAFASIEAVSNIVLALEMIWMAAAQGNPSLEPATEPQSEQEPATEPQSEQEAFQSKQLPFKRWKLNEVGMSMLLHNPTGRPAQRAGEQAAAAEK